MIFIDMKSLLMVSLISIVLVAGCTSNMSPTDIAKGTMFAQSFLAEYPNAKIVAVYVNQNTMSSILPQLQADCGSQMTSKDYWKITITDQSTNLNAVVWVDAQKQQPVCAIRTAMNTTIIQPNPAPSKPPTTENGLPDLIISNFDIEPKFPIVGQQINVSITIKNVGTATAYPVVYILYVNGSATRSNENEPPLSLSPGKIMTYKITSYNVVTKYNIGTYVIKTEVNPAGVNGQRLVKESNYDNNVAEETITVTGDESCVPNKCDPSNCRIQPDGCGGTLYCTCPSGLMCSNADATCKPQITLEVSPAGSGTACANNICASDSITTMFEINSNVTFLWTPYNGYTFDHYEVTRYDNNNKASATYNNFTAILDSSFTVVAYFNKNSTIPTPYPKVGTPNIMLFVMSLCPYGMPAENALEPVISELGFIANFNIHFIANISGDSVTAIHGPLEAQEDLRQACIFAHNNNMNFWNYVMKINSVCSKLTNNTDSYNACWQNAATELDLSISDIETCSNGAEGISLLKADGNLINSFGVLGSPTLIINGVAYNGERTTTAYKQAICSSFVTVPPQCL